MAYYICRNKNCSQVVLYRGKPQLDENGIYYETFNSELLQAFCYVEFKRVTGMTLKPGECKRVKIRITEY